MSKNVTVKKRNGSTEKFDIEKINKVIKWAIDGLSNVSLTDIEINAKINMHDGITTKEIHKLLIESAANLISVEKPNYQFVAGRLLNYQLRKDVWKGKHAPRLLEFINQGLKNKIYDNIILEKYTERINNQREFFKISKEDLLLFFSLIDGEYWSKSFVPDEKAEQESASISFDEDLS